MAEESPPQTGVTDWAEDCPRPPERLEDLPFERRPMVDWLAPPQLASTGIKALLSSIFGAYADKREVQAALRDMGDGEELYDGVYREEELEEGFWLDYCADVGDGFDSTYSVAWLLSRESLSASEDPEPSRRGRVLVLGGDQVYPTAHRTEYNNRFVGPYRSALPWVPPAETPHLFAIPGNHDWYDGLTAFTRLFCQGRWLGGWKTQQRRSYFALRLPHNWWLWGTDIQLEADIDRPQMEYFQDVAQQMTREAADTGDGPPRLILCTAQPTWVYCDDLAADSSCPARGGCRFPVDPEQFTSLEYFHREVIGRHGIRLAVVLAGDLHHFAHYRLRESSQDPNPVGGDGKPEHLITCGGGGAYLYPTHHLPLHLAVPWSRRTRNDAVEQATGRYDRQAIFPAEEDSRRLGRWSWVRLPWRNRGFSFLIAGIYLLYGWMLQSASKSGNFLFENWWPQYAAATGKAPSAAEAEVPRSLIELLAALGLGELPRALHGFWDVLRHSPSGVVFALVVVFGLWQFRKASEPVFGRGLGGLLHGLGHLLLSFVLIWIFAWLNLGVIGLKVDSPWQVLLFSAEILVAGGLLGGWLFGLYLMITSRISGAHINEVFSSQSLPSHKSFLRLHIGEDGKLTIHPFGVPRVPGRWRFRGGDDGLEEGDPWFDPPGNRIEVTRIGDRPVEIH